MCAFYVILTFFYNLTLFLIFYFIYFYIIFILFKKLNLFFIIKILTASHMQPSKEPYMAREPAVPDPCIRQLFTLGVTYALKIKVFTENVNCEREKCMP